MAPCALSWCDVGVEVRGFEPPDFLRARSALRLYVWNFVVFRTVEASDKRQVMILHGFRAGSGSLQTPVAARLLPEAPPWRHYSGDETRTKPSWTTEATRRPSRLKTWPRASPRAPDAAGDSWRYSSHSSARNGPWNHIA
jgi:hypothetical protein